MTRSRGLGPLSHDVLAEGFALCIRNVQEYMRIITQTSRLAPGKALALAELGQEEVGKSFLILAAFGLPSEAPAWRPFWRDWHNHRRKAHAAFFYEWLNPIRVLVPQTNGKMLDGMPMRTPISREKEEGLYVDYDRTSGRFVLPSEHVRSAEATSRTMTFVALSITAVQVYSALMEEDAEFRFAEFAKIPLFLLSRATPQQAMRHIYRSFSKRSDRHRALVVRLRLGYARAHTILKKAEARKRSQALPHISTP